jgi:hypothetical protein
MSQKGQFDGPRESRPVSRLENGHEHPVVHEHEVQQLSENMESFEHTGEQTAPQTSDRRSMPPTLHETETHIEEGDNILEELELRDSGSVIDHGEIHGITVEAGEIFTEEIIIEEDPGCSSAYRDGAFDPELGESYTHDFEDDVKDQNLEEQEYMDDKHDPELQGYSLLGDDENAPADPNLGNGNIEDVENGDIEDEIPGYTMLHQQESSKDVEETQQSEVPKINDNAQRIYWWRGGGENEEFDSGAARNETNINDIFGVTDATSPLVETQVHVYQRDPFVEIIAANTPENEDPFHAADTRSQTVEVQEDVEHGPFPEIMRSNSANIHQLPQPSSTPFLLQINQRSI